jgi:hypothetical protein
VALTWDQVASGDFPVTPAQQLFSSVVIATAAQAKASMPDANGCVEQARDLVLGGLVSPNSDGTFTVKSASKRGKSYLVSEGVCECPDAEKLADHHCKHLLATWLWHTARQTLAAQLARNGHQPEEAPAAPLAQPPLDGTPVAEARTTPAQARISHTHHEATASMNTYVDIAGYRVQVTIRTMNGETETDLHRRMEAYLRQFPAPEAPQHAAVAEIPTETPTETPTTSEGWCQRHACQMYLQTSKDPSRPGQWWSHRLADGTWCKGK